MNARILRKKMYPYLFLAPFGILTLLFFIIPALSTVWMSMTNLDAKMKPRFIGFDNFKRLASDPNLWPIIKITLIYVLLCLLTTVVFSLVLAICSQYLVKNKKIGAIYRAIWLIPGMLPGLIFVVFWKWLFSPTPRGFANEILHWLGMTSSVSWWNEAGIYIFVLAHMISSASGGMILFSAQINQISEDLYKAARVDGAGERSIILDIIMPALRWPIMYVTITSAIGLFSSYEFILLTTGGGPVYDTTPLSLYGYTIAFNKLQYGYGAAISLIVVIVSLLLTLWLFKIFNFNKLIQPPRIED